VKTKRKPYIALLESSYHDGKRRRRYYWFRIMASNGRKICHSETYNSPAARANAIKVFNGQRLEIRLVA
jgi:uncharacterized protein YegP (UPF0339 family)